MNFLRKQILIMIKQRQAHVDNMQKYIITIRMRLLITIIDRK